MSDYLQRALEALESGASEIRHLSRHSAAEVRVQLRRTAEEILDHLEAEERARDGSPEDIFSTLDRQSKDIADDLRRAERLMRERMGRDPNL